MEPHPNQTSCRDDRQRQPVIHFIDLNKKIDDSKMLSKALSVCVRQLC